MEILVIGEDANLRECKAKFGEQHEYTCTNSHTGARKHFRKAAVVFDFLIDEDLSQFQVFIDCPAPVFLNSVKSSLATIVDNQAEGMVYGFNGLPSFLNRPVLEVTLLDKTQRGDLEKVCSQLGTVFEIVEDNPGMVTPRIVCMIINEAYCAIEDGTATAADIDIAMKLGTNYPIGPIEWSKKIGVKNVVDVLEAVYRSSGDARYQICNLLQDEARREI